MEGLRSGSSQLGVFMRQIILVLSLSLLACLPTQSDVEKAVDDATESATNTCRELFAEFVSKFVREELPAISRELVADAVSACTGLERSVIDTQDIVKEARELIVHDVLVSLGCNVNNEESGPVYDCSSSKLLCDRN
jgi:hypothetical protein